MHTLKLNLPGHIKSRMPWYWCTVLVSRWKNSMHLYRKSVLFSRTYKHQKLRKQLKIMFTRIHTYHKPLTKTFRLKGTEFFCFNYLRKIDLISKKAFLPRKETKKKRNSKLKQSKIKTKNWKKTYLQICQQVSQNLPSQCYFYLSSINDTKGRKHPDTWVRKKWKIKIIKTKRN